MADTPAVLFFNSNKVYSVGLINFDLILSESHNFSNAISEYNIENGSIISDHIQNQLENGSFSGFISNYSIQQGAIVSNRAQDVFDELYKLWKDKTLVDIVTVYKVYKDVAIEGINVSKDESIGEALFAEITFKKVNIVKLKEIILQTSINIPDLDNNLNRQSAENVDLGRTTGVL